LEVKRWAIPGSFDDSCFVSFRYMFLRVSVSLSNDD
jgi:hypothetical protein